MTRTAVVVIGLVGGVALVTVFQALRRPTATDAPGFREPIEQVSRRQALEYARGLQFDTSAARSDARRLSSAVMFIAPERGAHRLTSAELSRGRIIARVRTTASVPKLGFPKGESFLWADSSATGWRWIIVPVDSIERLRQLPMLYERHLKPGCENSGAKVLGEETGGMVWVGCSCQACCCIQAGPECIPLKWSGELPGQPAVPSTDPLRSLVVDTLRSPSED